MSKIMTPMKRLKTHFEAFGKLTNHLNLGCFELQYREESHYSYPGDWYDDHDGIKKGIDSDFIRIFKINEERSLSFKFTFLSDDKKTVIEPQYMEVIFKEKGLYDSSKAYTIEESKSLLKSINNFLMHSGRFNAEHLFNSLKGMCVMNDSVKENTEEQFLKQLANDTASVQYDYRQEIQSEIDLTEKLSQDTGKLNRYQKNIKETKELRELEKEIREKQAQARVLRTQIEEKVAKKSETLEISKTRNLITSAQNTIRDYAQEIINNGRIINEKYGLPMKRLEEILKDVVAKK